jgi:hypothetical protein
MVGGCIDRSSSLYCEDVFVNCVNWLLLGGLMKGAQVV